MAGHCGDQDKGCALCRYGMEVFKLKRQWVHHDATSGRVYICTDRVLKPMGS